MKKNRSLISWGIPIVSILNPGIPLYPSGRWIRQKIKVEFVLYKKYPNQKQLKGNNLQIGGDNFLEKFL
jgi:hypothetical protein